MGCLRLFVCDYLVAGAGGQLLPLGLLGVLIFRYFDDLICVCWCWRFWVF